MRDPLRRDPAEKTAAASLLWLVQRVANGSHMAGTAGMGA
jgi:hypothetical protein